MMSNLICIEKNSEKIPVFTSPSDYLELSTLVRAYLSVTHLFFWIARVTYKDVISNSLPSLKDVQTYLNNHVGS